MKQVDSFFETKATVPLYHYTGVGSLLGISSSKSLWASSISYMNDSKEIIHACETIENVLKAYFSLAEQNEEYEFLKQFQAFTNTFKNTTHTIFVFSLSEVPSLLSQWRSYTPHGKGVSIEFSPAMINHIVQSSNLKIARCIYDKVEQEEIILALIEKLLISFRQQLLTIDKSKHHPTQSYYYVFRQYINDILQVLAIIKHPAFQEEREWRLISPYYLNLTDPKIKFREGASMLVPYIELPLGDSKPFFQNVILGPSPHQNLSMSTLTMLLAKEGLCGQTTNCGIPYREW